MLSREQLLKECYPDTVSNMIISISEEQLIKLVHEFIEKEYIKSHMLITDMAIQIVISAKTKQLDNIFVHLETARQLEPCDRESSL